MIDKMLENPSEIDVQDVFGSSLIALLYISSFGQKHDLNDVRIKKIGDIVRTLETENFILSLTSQSFFFKMVFYRRIKKAMELNRTLRNFIEEIYHEHERTFVKDNNRDFIDSLLAARTEAEEEGDEEVRYVTKTNIINSVTDLFFAGTQTTREVMMWWMLFYSLYPEMQETIRQEISAILPNESDTPTLDMKEQCPFMTAFTQEVFRFRINALTLPHQAMCDTEIAGHKIKAGTIVVGALFKAMLSEDCWPNANEFKPERFLDEEGRFINKHNPYFLCFGGGRRACVGEKLAMANLFLIFCRLIQKTRNKGSFQAVMKDGVTRESLLHGDANELVVNSAGKYYVKLV